MPAVAVPELVDELWRKQSVWSQTADRMKAAIDRARLAALIIVVLVALAGTLAAQLAEPAPVLAGWSAALAALGSGLLPFLRPRWTGTALQNWTRARSVSEALKTAVHLWLAGAGPYRTDPDGTELRTRTDRLLATAADLADEYPGIEPARRDLPPITDPTTFFALRVTHQIDEYYGPKARELSSRLRLFAWIERLLGLAGLIIGVLAVLTGAALAAWIAVLTTVATAVAVHVAATRYEFQRIEFRRTATRLEQLRARAAGADLDRLRDLVVKAEDVISVENQGWMAKLAEDPADHAAPGAS
jgi:hypothetical protein